MGRMFCSGTPGKVSGAWVFAGTRIPVSALYENLAGGATIEEFVEWFPGVDEQQVRTVLEHEAKALKGRVERRRASLRARKWQFARRFRAARVERTPGKVSGAWVFAGTRIPVSALYENLAGGATIEEFVEWFPGVDEQQVRTVLEHEAKALKGRVERRRASLRARKWQFARRFRAARVP